MGLGRGPVPVLLPGTPITPANAGAPPATMVALIAIFIAAALLVGPSFALLFSMQSRRLLGAGEQGTLPAGVAAGHTGQPPAAIPRPVPRPATRGAVLGTIVIAAVIRRLRHR